MFKYFDTVVRGTAREDALVILQFLQGMIGQQFTFLNYFKEIPISYDVTLLSVENEMAEFAVHDYQAKVIKIEKRTLIYSPAHCPFAEDLIAEAFYVSSVKKRVILCNFGYAQIKSDLRQFVRVLLDEPIDAELYFEGDILKGNVVDISLGGAAIQLESADLAVPELDINLLLKLPDSSDVGSVEIGLGATIVKVVGASAPYTCIVKFHPEKNSQQQIAYYINQRQVEIIKDLKDIN